MEDLGEKASEAMCSLEPPRAQSVGGLKHCAGQAWDAAGTLLV